ncbi:MAG: vWA domain-containing protein [Bacteroidota bacterium]|jgi:hypothetical protein
MPELHFSLSFRVVLLLLAGMCSVAMAMIVYRVTVPPVSSIKRIVLISLRSFGLFFLFLLIGEPLLSLITHSVDQPIVAVLVDNSQSMAIKDKVGRRDETLKSILRSSIWQQIGKDGRVDYSLFDGKVRNLSAIAEDSLTLNGEATDIAEALKSIKRTSASSNLQAVVLITDGNSTVGMNPLYEAEELGVPVFTIGVGDTSEQKDILIHKVLTNEITYVGTTVPVNVMVHSAGFGGERAQVSLREGATILDEKSLVLEPGSRDYLVPLSFIPEKEGMQKFEAEISQLPGELALQNNRMSFFTKVLKSKLHVTLVAGSPSQDVACIQNMLTDDKNIEVKTFIERENGRFYEGELTAQGFAEADCLVIIGFPTLRSTPQSLQVMLAAEKPLLTVLSRTMNFDKLRTLDPVLPFSAGSVDGNNEIQVFANVPEAQQNNPILKIGNAANSLEVWSKLPPVFQPKGIFRAKVESEILATVRIQSASLNDPFIVARNVNKKKSVSVLGYGLWRWNMLSSSGSGTEKVLESFLGNAIRWLTTQEDARRIVVQPSKHIFTTQDAVEFTAQVYDDSFQPLDDAQIEVRVQRGNEMSPLVLNSLGSGQYQGVYDRLSEGDYKFVATVKVNGTLIGQDQGTFSVGGFDAEYLETRMNKSLLQQIAAQTGGRYYESNEFSSLLHDVTSLPNFKTREVSKSAEIEIWNSHWMLALVIFVFALEWFLRKQNGML